MVHKEHQTSSSPSREAILECLLEATSLLHHGHMDSNAVRESFAMVAELVRARAVCLCRLRKTSLDKLVWSTYGIEQDVNGWREVPPKELPQLPTDCLPAFSSQHFQSVGDTLHLDGPLRQFWAAKVDDKGLVLIDTRQSGLLEHLCPFVRALGGFVARQATEEKKIRIQYDNFIKHTTEGIYNIHCDPPIPLHLSLEEKVRLFYERAYIRDCNQALAVMYGVAQPEDLIGTKIVEVHGDEADNPNRLVVRRLFSDGLQIRDLETTERRKDGSPAWFVNHSVGVVEAGLLTGVWGGQIDITARKQLELDLRHKSNELELILEGAKAATWYWNIPENKAVYNEYFARILGLTVEEVPSTTEGFLDIVHPDDLERFIRKVQRHLQPGNSEAIFEHEMRLRHNEGSYRWVLNRGRVMEWSSSGQPIKGSGLIIDISARKRMELALRDSKQRTEMILDAAQLGLWELNTQTNHCYYNRYWGEMLGFSPDEIEPHRSTFERLIHNEDKGKVWPVVLQHLEGETPYFDAEVRLRTKKGGWKWIYDQGRIVEWDNEGRPLRVVGIHMDIDERKRAGEELRQREAVFRSLFEHSPLAILFCDLNGQILQLNSKAAELLGGQVEKLIGQSIQRFAVDKELLSALAPLSVPGGDPVVELEQPLIKINGDRILAKLLFSAPHAANGQPDRFICSIDDVTERRAAQEALQRSQALKQAILEALPDMKFLLSRDGRFLDYFGTGSDEDSLLIPPQEFAGQFVRDILPAYLVEALMGNLEKAISQRGVQTFNYPLMLKGGLHHYEARLSAVNAEECIVVIRDVTNLRLAQQRLRRKVEELDRNNEMLTRYVDSNTQLENFAHTVSHDLREPVRTMKSFARLLQSKYGAELDEDANTYLGFIADSAQHMNMLIEDLLEFARFTNNPEPGFKKVDVQALIETVLGSLRGMIRDKNAIVEIDGSLPTLQGNPTKLRQLFQNLISNGIKFSRAGVRPVIRIAAHQKGPLWQFEISDNGIGIEQTDYKRIFQLFRRLHSKKVFPGSGIGLALCQRVVEQHGGHISVVSEIGKGSTFSFTLHQDYS
ncbi:MAG: PAS domain S-box protein [Bacteroidetes bacterium]|nr:PAS domain S-box protein [Bacteroidota bacterium]